MCFTEHCESSGFAAEVPPALLRDVPRDQALGLRLIVLARAAAALHMAQLSPADPRAQTHLEQEAHS